MLTDQEEIKENATVVESDPIKEIFMKQGYAHQGKKNLVERYLKSTIDYDVLALLEVDKDFKITDMEIKKFKKDYDTGSLDEATIYKGKLLTERFLSMLLIHIT